jgi:alpha-acetolactate decarboxylase
VLELTFADGTVKYEEIAGLDLQLPRSEAFAKADQTKDRAEEVKRVEGKQ